MDINLSNRILFCCFLFITTGMVTTGARLRFDNKSGEFKIVQVADMHYTNGRWTGCLDVFPDQVFTCSDLNTTDFLYRIIRAENPDLVVFTGVIHYFSHGRSPKEKNNPLYLGVIPTTLYVRGIHLRTEFTRPGDNIYGHDTIDPVKSMNMAFDPVVALKLPWAAVLGNHDQESYLSREAVMRHIITMPYTLSRLNPNGSEIDGYGNYNIEISGPEGSPLVNKSVLNLYFLDSSDYSTVPSIHGYGWIKLSQQVWFQKTSLQLQKVYKSAPHEQKESAPGLVYFHIPLPEYASFDSSNFTGVKQEGIGSASINSGFFTTMVEAGDVRAVFTGHDHLNDFCGKLTGIQLCYAGGFGYHAYGKAGWPRRTRVVSAFLEKTADGQWGGVESIKTWKRLDDQYLSTIDSQVLWSKG